MIKESINAQELGPKKYRDKIEKSNKFYDKYKAGKRDPKTGEFYHNIDFKNPCLKRNLGATAGTVKCFNCDNFFDITTNTKVVICSRCKKLNYVVFNRDDDTIEVSSSN